MRILSTLLSFIWLSGCGTLTTLSSSDEKISGQLLQKNTYCESLPRIYSGLAYDVCILNSKPIGSDIDLLVGFYLVDGVLSAATDTVVLPYTIFQQSEKGSIQVVR